MKTSWGQWIGSVLFTIQLYAVMAVLGVLLSPWALFSRNGARFACKVFCRWTRWTARWMVGITTEVRGLVPDGEVMIAAKHQSFLDIILIFEALPAAKFIMKRSLLWTPFIGQYAYRLGCVPVSRGKRGAAITKMMRDVRHGMAQPGQLVIYPQGTRVPPGKIVPYKVGVGVLYDQLGQTCVPAATNAGVFWPRRGVVKHPGHAIVQFLDPVPAGRTPEAFLEHLEDVIETASDKLLQDARQDGT